MVALEWSRASQAVRLGECEARNSAASLSHRGSALVSKRRGWSRTL